MSDVILGPWLTGEGLTALTIEDIAIAADGTITYGDAKNLLAVFSAITPSTEITSEDIRPTNVPTINMVPHSYGDGCRLQCLKRSALPAGPLDGDDSANTLDAVIRNSASNRFRLTWSEGADDYQFVYTMQSWNGGIQNRGANHTEVVFVPMALAGAEQGAVDFGTA